MTTVEKCPVVDSSLRKPVIRVVRRTPVIAGDQKKPVTQEQLALLFSSGELPDSVSELYAEELYNSIAGLVYGLAQKYTITCRDDIDDLVNDCWKRIISKIHLFDPENKGGKWTTWSWKVCTSVLNKKYKKTKKHESRFVELPEGLDENRAEGASKRRMVGHDIYDTVDALIDLYPDKKDLLVGVFGRRGCGPLPTDVDVRGAARKCGMKTSTASRFFRKVVRPFFKQRFGGEERCRTH